MDIENLKERIKSLREEQAIIDGSIATARVEIQSVVNLHNNRITTLLEESNKLAGKIDILRELLALEKPEASKKGK